METTKASGEAFNYPIVKARIDTGSGPLRLAGPPSAFVGAGGLGRGAIEDTKKLKQLVKTL